MDTVCLALGLDFSATVVATDSFDGPARGASKDFVGFLSADLSEATDIGFDRAMSEKMEDKITEQSDKCVSPRYSAASDLQAAAKSQQADKAVRNKVEAHKFYSVYLRKIKLRHVLETIRRSRAHGACVLPQ